MKKIIEKKNASGICYEVNTYDADNNLINTELIQTISYDVLTEDGSQMTMFYDAQMNPIDDVIRFLNFGGLFDITKRYMVHVKTALKFLYNYLAVFDLKLNAMNEDNIDTFMNFLRCRSASYQEFSIEFCMSRSDKTIGLYLKILRRFVDFLGYDHHILLKKTDDLLNGNYDVSSSVDSAFHTTDIQYITPVQFKGILDVCTKTLTPLRDQIICRLMFEHGLHIKEILALTLEDVNYVAIDDSLVEYTLEIRNRASNNKDRQVSTLMAAPSNEVYTSKAYKTNGIGYQRIIINPSLGRDIVSYILKFHKGDNEQFLLNREKYAKADSIHEDDGSSESNYYLFLNSLGKKTGRIYWNNELHDIFNTAGLKDDFVKKRNHMNGKLRYGYEMILRNTLHYSENDISILMRTDSSLFSDRVFIDKLANLQRKAIKDWRKVHYGI